jgi:hypothetical protein
MISPTAVIVVEVPRLCSAICTLAFTPINSHFLFQYASLAFFTCLRVF